MKKVFWIVFIILFFPLFVKGDFIKQNFKFYKNINDVGLHDGLVSFQLDKEILTHSKENLEDIRIIDDENNEVAFKIEKQKDEIEEKEIIKTNLINNTFSSDKINQVIIEMPRDGLLINRFYIDTLTNNYKANVTLFGSNQMGNWQLINENKYIFNYSDNRAGFTASSDYIDFNPSVFHYYRMEIRDSEEKQVKISSIKAINSHSNETEWVEYQDFKQEQSNNEETIIDLDFRESGIFISKANLRINEPQNFDRNLQILTSDDKESWETLGYTRIFNYETPKFNGEKLYFDFKETNKRYLRLKIFNYNDNPLEIEKISLFGISRKLYFPANKNRSYFVYFSNNGASQPIYDFEKTLMYFDKSEAKQAKLSNMIENPTFEEIDQRPLSEKIPFLLPGVLILLSFVLIIITYKAFFKKS